MPSAPTANPWSWIDDLVIAAAAIALCLVYLATSPGDFPLDDSWIHQTYARNLAQYGQWSFVPGELSAASTSPLYTVVLTIGYWLNVPFRVWTHGVGIVALALTGIIGARLSRRLLPGSKISHYLVGLALITSWHLIWSAVSGMETVLFNLFTLLAIAWAWRELFPPTSETLRAVALRGAVFGLIGALTVLTRAEGVVLIALLGIGLIPARPGRSWMGLVIYGSTALLVFALTLTPYVVLNLQLTGGLLPDTAAAKRAYAAPLFATPYLYRVGLMLEPLIAGGQLLLLPGLLSYVVLSLRRRGALLIFLSIAWSAALIVVYAAVLPLNFQHGRYVIPALPVIILFGTIGTIGLVRIGRHWLITRVLTRTLALTAAAVFTLFAFGLGLNAYRQDVQIIEEEMVAAALWLRDHVPPTDLLAIHDIGAVGYFAPRPLLDVAGLISPEVVPFVGDPDGLWRLIETSGARYLMGLEDQVPGGDRSDARLCLVYTSGKETARRAGGSNMSIYALDFGDGCRLLPP
ncbi:MAG: hypothetical protein SGJ24_01595 [Chloroflexota bacterium]|nr:hypothetical protein [Chloroflexota bacterium]